MRPPHVPATAVLCHALLAAALAAAPQAYLDRQSAAPGETVAVFAQTSSPTHTVKVYRSHGFNNEVQVLASAAVPRRVQPVAPGSYAWRPTAAPLEIVGGMSLEAWIYPTHRNGIDFFGILSKLGIPGNASYAVYLQPDGRVTFYLGRTGQFDPLEQLTTSRPVPLRQWTHVVATFNGETKRIYLNAAIDVSQDWTGPVFKSAEPLRIGAYGQAGNATAFFHGMIDSPAIYDRALFAGEVEQRHRERANYGPSNPGLLPLTIASWHFNEQEGNVLADVTGNGYHLTVVNHGTRGVEGPSPRNATEKSHSIRFAADDLFNPPWESSWSFVVPATWDNGFYVVEVEDGATKTRLPLIVKPPPDKPDAHAPIAVLAATNTWHGYNPWAGNLYQTHADGTIRYYVGLRQPNPGAYVDLHQPGVGYSHATDAERYLWEWLEQNGYNFDLYSDLDLHRSPALLDDYRVLVLNGHSEFWTHEMVDRVEAFLARGGNLVNLAGNAMWSLVTFNSDFTVMEGRQHPHAAGTIPAAERWHSQAGGVLGGTLRCVGRPEQRLLGTGYGMKLDGGSFGVYDVYQPHHWVFEGTNLTYGSSFGSQSLNGNAILGHLADTIAPEVSPPNIHVLAVGRFPVAAQLRIGNCQTRSTVMRTSGCEMIYYDHPGGQVFGAPSIAFGGSLPVDPVVSRLLRNVLDRFQQLN